MNKYILKTIGTVSLMFAASVFSTANASLITADSITGSGTYNNNADLIINNTYPAEGIAWTDAMNVWWYGTTPTFTIDFGELFDLDDVQISADLNDSYLVEWSTDASNWTDLFTIEISYGDINWGMDTMSTDSNHGEYVSGIDFSSVAARYLKVSATGGDGKYSIGELQAFGTSSSVPVPEPMSLALFGLACIAFGFRRFKL